MFSPISATSARKDIFRLLDGVINNHEPILVTTKTGNVVWISEEDWRGIEETLYLLSIPGMREALLEARKEEPETMTRLEEL